MGRFSKANKKTFIIDLATVDSKEIMALSPWEPHFGVCEVNILGRMDFSGGAGFLL